MVTHLARVWLRKRDARTRHMIVRLSWSLPMNTLPLEVQSFAEILEYQWQ